MTESSGFEAVLKRDRSIVAAGLISITALAWLYTVHLAWMMDGMDMSMAMPRAQAWGAVELLLVFVMWMVMMIAMMTPTAAPMILLFAAVNRKRRERNSPFTPTAVFAAGYLLAWVGFSAAATLAQWRLQEAFLLSPAGVSTSTRLGGGILIAAGVFQWLPWKSACLRHCRSPLSFLTTQWKDGTGGALLMGLKHGGYCTGCCWALMALLFVGGVMNLLWIAGLTIFVLLEKVLPRGEMIGKIAGAGLAVGGVWLLLGG